MKRLNKKTDSHGVRNRSTDITGGAIAYAGKDLTRASDKRLRQVRLPKGCRFAGRCGYAITRCHSEPPPVRTVATGHAVACHLVGDAGETPHRPAQL